MLKRNDSINNLTGYLFILPASLLLLVFVVYPLAANIYNSFHSWNLINSAKFIGARNFVTLFRSSEFYITLKNTLLYPLIIIPSVLVTGFVLAYFIQIPGKLNVLYRTVYFIPRVTSMVAMSSVWLFLYNPQYGFLNTLLIHLGLPGVRWLNEPSSALVSVAVIIIWRTIGYATVLFLTGLQNIPSSVIEAAELDGISGMRRIWYIELPLVSPTSFMLLILTTIDSLKLFTTIDVMTQGGPAGSTQNLVVMLYKYGFLKYQIGYASTVSIVLFLLIFAVNLIQMRLEKKVVYD